jgi:GTP-binding protein
METHIKYPKVLIVGRMNVGKSTLFNRLTEQKRSIVFEYEGVTRDYVQEVVSYDDKSFLLVDTGGLSFQKQKDEIGHRVQEKVLSLLSEADLLLFIVDGKNGMTEEDGHIARILRRTSKPVLLIVNKADNTRAMEENLPEFYSLGFDELIPVSSIHATGITKLFEAIAKHIQVPVVEQKQRPHYKVAILGRPNVGKSSLMNLLIQHERSIVSSVAGTTREAISELAFHCNDLIQLTDTAGVRRSRKIDDDLEELMVKSTMQAVRDADIVLIMIDSSEGKIADQELKLLFYAYEQQKMLIALFNKTDLLEQDDYKRTTLDQSIDEYQFIFKKIPTLWISCATKKNVAKIFDEIQRVWQRAHQPINNLEVDEIVKKELLNKPLYHTELELKVFRVKAIEGASIPTFTLLVNHPLWFGPTEKGCIENILRKHYDFTGCPIHLITTKKED